jgi:hypothetical protein
MNFDQNLFDTLQQQNISKPAKLLWVALHFEKPEEDGFFFFKCEDWIQKVDASRPTLYRYLKNLEDQGLILRRSRSLSIDDQYPINRGGGCFSFIKVLPPEKESNMTFFGKLYQIGTSTHNNSTAVFKDVYNIPDTIRFQYAFCDLEENKNNSLALQNIEIDQSIVFKACVKRSDQNKPFIANIWNIRSAEDFYANR